MRYRATEESYYFATLIIVPGVLMLLVALSSLDRDSYLASFTEDRWLSWMTFAVWFLSGVIAACRSSLEHGMRRSFYLLLTLFCWLVALEEINWGQRIVGWNSPELISEQVGHDELSVHYILQGFSGLPVAALAGVLLLFYGGILPLAFSLSAKLRSRFPTLTAFLPVTWIVPWFFLAAAIVVFEIPGISSEIGEFIFSVCFLYLVSCPKTLTLSVPRLKKEFIMAFLLCLGLLSIPYQLEKSHAQEQLLSQHAKEEIVTAVSSGNHLAVISAIKNFPQLTGKKLDELKVLPLATRIGGLELIKVLLDFGASPEVTDESGKTPLILAIEAGDIQTASTMLSLGADPDFSDELGNPPLVYAIQQKRMTIVRELIRSGAEVNTRDVEGLTPLMLAVQVNMFGAVDLLLQNGASYTELDPAGRSILELAQPGSESEVIILAAISGEANGGMRSVLELSPAKLSLADRTSSVWDSDDGSLLIFLSLEIENLGEQQANGVEVQLIDDGELVASMSGEVSIRPGERERFTLVGKNKINNKTAVTLRVVCENCSKEEEFSPKI